MSQMQRMRSFGLLSAASGMGILLADACAVDAGRAVSGAGEMLMDAGAAFADAGESLVDAGNAIRDGGRDASAQSGSQVPTKSGSRIEMRYAIQRGSDGSVYAHQATPYDTQRKEDCSPTVFYDGTTRCAPTGAGIYGAGSYFSDNGCTKPVVIQLKCQPAPPYILVFGGTGQACAASTARIYATGTQPSQVFIGTPAACNPYPVDASLAAYSPGSEIPATSFVEFAAREYQVID